MLHFPSILMNRLNETESAVVKFCRFSLILKDPFFPDYLSPTSENFTVLVL